ncbi:MAG: HEPN domain-containing protein [Acidihalobacter sp.]|uniref:HEPN domain-containing protein n=1 Tax=Acidihalobacter sp. TaxID=1872108 RepID=UPI00307CE5AD
MAYQDHFSHADDVITSLQAYVPTITDPLMQIKFIGFVAVSAVTVYEQAIKSIFIEFGEAKNKVFGKYVESHFERINGRIKYQIIKDEYVPQFGDKYKKRFKRNMERRSKVFLATQGRDVRSSYGNIIIWRNDFAHEGRINTTATFAEVVTAYEDGKEIIHCLAETMRR